MATQSKYVQAVYGAPGDWTNEAEAIGAPDAVCASSPSDGDISYYDFTGDLFTIPGGATITGIEVVVVSAANDSDDDYFIALEDPGAAYTANKEGVNSDGPDCDPNAAADAALGGAADDWTPGTPWTVSHLNSTSFRVRLTQEKEGKQGTTYVDSIYVTIHYTAVTTYDRSVLLDVLLQTPDISRSVDFDVVTKAVDVPLSVLLDLITKKENIPLSVLLDVLIKLRADRTVILDLITKAEGVPKSVLLDLVTKKENIPLSVLLDVLLKYSTTLSTDLDVLIKAEGVPLSVLLDLVIKALGVGRSVDLDVATQKVGIPLSVLLDLITKKSDIPRSVLLDVYLQAAGVTTYTRTVLVDMILKKEGITRSVLLDIVLSTGEEIIRLPIEGQIRRRRRKPRPKPELGSFTREIAVTIYEELAKIWPFLTRIWELEDLTAGLHQLVYVLEGMELEAFDQTIFETEMLQAEFIPYQMFGIIEDLEEASTFKAKIAKLEKLRKLRRELTVE